MSLGGLGLTSADCAIIEANKLDRYFVELHSYLTSFNTAKSCKTMAEILSEYDKTIELARKCIPVITKGRHVKSAELARSLDNYVVEGEKMRSRLAVRESRKKTREQRQKRDPFVEPVVKDEFPDLIESATKPPEQPLSEVRLREVVPPPSAQKTVDCFVLDDPEGAANEPRDDVAEAESPTEEDAGEKMMIVRIEDTMKDFEDQESRKKKCTVITVLVIVVLVIIALGLFYVWWHKK